MPDFVRCGARRAGGVEPMSNEVKAEVSFWEKLGDGLSAFSEGVGQFLTRMLGSSNERYVRKLGYIRAARKAENHTEGC